MRFGTPLISVAFLAMAACGSPASHSSSSKDLESYLPVEDIRYGISLSDDALTSEQSIQTCVRQIASIPGVTVLPYDPSLVMIIGYIEADVPLGAEDQFVNKLNQMLSTCVSSFSEEGEPAIPQLPTERGDLEANLPVLDLRYGISLLDEVLTDASVVEGCANQIRAIPGVTVLPFDVTLVMITGYIEADVALGAESQFLAELEQMRITCISGFSEEGEPAEPYPSTRIGN